jgi:AcrR family transcriptional regulator
MATSAIGGSGRRVMSAAAGPRARETQQRILNCVSEMLTTSSFRDIKVADVARRMRSSPGTFYHYFPDIETVVLALAERMADEGAYLRDLVHDQDWRQDDGFAAAEQLVNGFLGFWRKHRSLLGVLDLAVLEGDMRFSNVRVRMLNAVTVALADIIEDLARDRGGVASSPVHNLAVAGALVGMMAHNSAYQDGFRLWQISIEQLRAAMVDIVGSSINGQGSGRGSGRAEAASSRAARRPARPTQGSRTRGAKPMT